MCIVTWFNTDFLLVKVLLVLAFENVANMIKTELPYMEQKLKGCGLSLHEGELSSFCYYFYCLWVHTIFPDAC